MPAETLRDWTKKGLPYKRDSRGHIWIEGRRMAEWLARDGPDHRSTACGWNVKHAARVRCISASVSPEEACRRVREAHRVAASLSMTCGELA